MRDYSGIDLEGLNAIATRDAMTTKELKEVANSYWLDIYGHKVFLD